MMASLKRTPTRLDRFRVFVRVQLPLLLTSAFVGISTSIALPGAFESVMLPLGLLVIAVVSTAALVLPWERWAPSWMITIAVADIVGVTFIRTELIWHIPSVGLLVIFPALWLAYGFRQGVVAVAILGAGFVTAFPFVVSGVWPSSALAWLTVVTLPVIIVAVALPVSFAASQLRRRGEKLAAASDKQALALRRALDNEILVRGVLDTVSAGVAFYSPDNKLLLSNQLAGEMTQVVGFRLDEPPYAGTNVWAADRQTPIPLENQIIPRALRGEAVEDHMEWLGPPGQQIAIVASSRQVKREDGALLGTVITAHDVTEHAAASALREEFLGTVSHELRTPLASALGYLELIADELTPSQTDPLLYLDVVNRNMRTLTDRIDYMLGAADTQHTLQLERTDAVELISSCLERGTDGANRRRIFLLGTAEALPSILVDPARMAQALDELIANAIKFSPAGSTVTVSATSDATSVQISVVDDGVSMTRSEQARVFDRFYRAQRARSEAVQGFGLGLFIVKNIMRMHGGQVTIGDGPTSGTCATLVIPTAAPAILAERPERGIPTATAD
jgi:signal transduction histidine kinase